MILANDSTSRALVSSVGRDRAAGVRTSLAARTRTPVDAAAACTAAELRFNGFGLEPTGRQSALVVDVAGCDEQEVREPIEISHRRRRDDLIGLRRKFHREPLGPAADRGEVKGRCRRRSTREHEGAQVPQGSFSRSISRSSLST